LLKGKEVDESKSKNVKLLLRKKSGVDKFNEIMIGNKEIVKEYLPELDGIVDESIIQ
jgi:hypothetical protein